jgi:hypothetical protein
MHGAALVQYEQMVCPAIDRFDEEPPIERHQHAIVRARQGKEINIGDMPRRGQADMIEQALIENRDRIGPEGVIADRLKFAQRFDRPEWLKRGVRYDGWPTIRTNPFSVRGHVAHARSSADSNHSSADSW